MSDQALNPATQPCYLCSSPAHRHCERCHRPICVTHTCSVPRRSWQKFSTSGGRGITSWSRYLPTPDAAPWKVCPACSLAIQRHDAQDRPRNCFPYRHWTIPPRTDVCMPIQPCWFSCPMVETASTHRVALPLPPLCLATCQGSHASKYPA